MLSLIPARLHRALYRLAYRVRRHYRQTFRIPIFGVNAVLRDRASRVLLVRHSYGPAGWTLPGGGHARGEDPALAVRRELGEELALEIAELELIETIEEVLSGAPHTFSLFAGIAVGDPMPDRREVIEARFFAPEELPDEIPQRARARLDLWFQSTGQSSES